MKRKYRNCCGDSVGFSAALCPGELVLASKSPFPGPFLLPPGSHGGGAAVGGGVTGRVGSGCPEESAIPGITFPPDYLRSAGWSLSVSLSSYQGKDFTSLPSLLLRCDSTSSGSCQISFTLSLLPQRLLLGGSLGGRARVAQGREAACNLSLHN